MISGTYCIKNTLNNRCYYGSSLDLKSRKYQHFRELRKNIHTNSFMQNDFNKCGEGVFEFTIMETTNELLLKEQLLLDLFFDNKRKCYNINPVAGASRLGTKHSEESKKLMSLSKKGKSSNRLGCSCTEEHKQKLSIANKGLSRPKSEETRKKMSEARIGKKFGPRTEKTKRKISETHKTLGTIPPKRGSK